MHLICKPFELKEIKAQVTRILAES